MDPARNAPGKNTDVSCNDVRSEVLKKLIQGASRDAGRHPLTWKSPVQAASEGQVTCCYLPREQAVLLWKISLPYHGIVYVGDSADSVDPAAPSQEHLPKMLATTMAERTHHVGGMSSVMPFCPVQDVRECLKTFAAEKLANHPLNTSLIKQHLDNNRVSYTPITSTTLAEAVACFALHTPRDTRVGLLTQTPRQEVFCGDTRVSEILVGANGMQMTDRAAVYRSDQPDITLYSTLQAHVVHFDFLSYEVVDWEGHGKVEVSSTHVWNMQKIQGDTLYSAIMQVFNKTQHKADVYEDCHGSLGVVFSPGETMQLNFLIASVIQEH